MASHPDVAYPTGVVAIAHWIVRNRAWTPWYLVRYWRFLRMRARNRNIVTRGLVFLDRGAEVIASDLGRIVLGRWVHLGAGTALRCHEGTLTVGDKAVFGRNCSVNCYLDVEVGASVLFADDIYVSDFDHNVGDLTRPIKDQGIAKARVRIDPDVWLGTKVTVTRGVVIGTGAVVGANAVVTHGLPPYAVAVGVPARVIRDRRTIG